MKTDRIDAEALINMANRNVHAKLTIPIQKMPRQRKILVIEYIVDKFECSDQAGMSP